MWQQRRLGKQVCHIPRGSYTAYARRRGASRAYLDVDHGCTLQMSTSPHEQRRCLDTAPKGRLCVVRRSRGPLLRTSRASGIDWRAAAKGGSKGKLGSQSSANSGCCRWEAPLARWAAYVGEEAVKQYLRQLDVELRGGCPLLRKSVYFDDALYAERLRRR